MKVKNFSISALIALIVLAPGNWLQAQPAGSAGKVEVEVKLSRNVIPAGDSAAAAVVMNIEDGWHVNAHEPTLDYLIGTELKIDTLSGFTVSGMQYPEPERFTFAFAGEPLDVYQGNAPIFFMLAASPDLAPGSYTLTGSLRVQACDDKSCLAPSTLDVSIPVEVAAANTGFKSINRELFSAYSGEPATTRASPASLTDNSIASMFNERGAILAFLGIFVIEIGRAHV